jgi:hypothetical protein
MNFPAAVCAAMLTGWTALLWGQSASMQSTRDSSQVLVLDHDFTGPGEIVRVFLQDGQIYRAEISSPNAVLEIRGVVRTIQVPHIYPFLPSQTPSGSTFLEIYPQKDAEYEIRSLGIGGTRLPTRLRLYRDIEASARRLYVRANRGWGIGVELAGGWHSAFVQSGAVAPAGTDPAGGLDLEGCFTARGSAFSSRFSLCVLGVGHQSNQDSRSILWVYTEPRFRLLGSGGARGSGWEVGPLFRFGVGMISAAPDTPVLMAPGVYLARFIRTSSRTDGWSLQASYSHPFYKGFARPTGAEPATPHGHRLSLGVGWYR